MNKNQKGFSIIVVLVIILTISLIGFVGWYVYSHQKSDSIQSSISGSERVLGHTIPRTDCKNVQPRIQNYSGLIVAGGDICYAGPIQAGEEKIEYLILIQSPEFQKNAEKEEEKNCTLDCGGTIPITRQDFIVRASGTIEGAYPSWSGSASIAIDYLTGCPLGDLGKYEDQGKFVVDKGRVGVYFAGKDIDYSARYGSSCKIDVDLIAFSSGEKPSLLFNSLGVHYNLADPNICVSRDEANSSANSDAEQCYSDQAGMRGDLSICNKTLHPSLGTMSGECVNAVAVRKLDDSICKNNYQTDACMDLVAEHKSYFSGNLVTTGL